MEPDRFQQGIKATLSRVHCQRSQFLLPCRNAHSAGSCLTFQYPAPDSVAICAAEAGHHFPDSIVPRRCTGAVGYHTPFVEHCWPAFDYYSVGAVLGGATLSGYQVVAIATVCGSGNICNSVLSSSVVLITLYTGCILIPLIAKVRL
jgi:hypothetical protein